MVVALIAKFVVDVPCMVQVDDLCLNLPPEFAGIEIGLISDDKVAVPADFLEYGTITTVLDHARASLPVEMALGPSPVKWRHTRENVSRANRMTATLSADVAYAGLDEDAVTDALADIMHMAAMRKIDFQRCFGRACVVMT